MGFLPLMMTVVSNPEPDEPTPTTTRDDESCPTEWLESLSQGLVVANPSSKTFMEIVL